MCGRGRRAARGRRARYHGKQRVQSSKQRAASAAAPAHHAPGLRHADEPMPAKACLQKNLQGWVGGREGGLGRRAGCQIASPRSPLPRTCDSCVVLPEPVSPMTTTTSFVSTARRMSSAYWRMGSSGAPSAICAAAAAPSRAVSHCLNPPAAEASQEARSAPHCRLRMAGGTVRSRPKKEEVLNRVTPGVYARACARACSAPGRPRHNICMQCTERCKEWGVHQARRSSKACQGRTCACTAAHAQPERPARVQAGAAAACMGGAEAWVQRS